VAQRKSSIVERDLRAARHQVGITRAQLARLAGVSISALGDIEAGYAPRRSRVLAKAWEVLDGIQSAQDGMAEVHPERRAVVS
jgi:predicted transcriptional regulator